MFKARVKAWGLKKYLKSNDVSAILHQQRSRAAVGKHSEFTINGRKVSAAALRRRLEKDPTLLTRFNGDAAASLISSRIQCRTPPPLPPSATKSLDEDQYGQLYRCESTSRSHLGRSICLRCEILALKVGFPVPQLLYTEKS